MQELKENSKPILFNTEMVKAILEGRKTQTRRVINLKDNSLEFTGYVYSTNKKRNESCAFGTTKERDKEFAKSKYKIDDILYVKEDMNIDCDLDVWYVVDDEYVDAFIDDGTKPYPKLNDKKYGSGYEEKHHKEYTGIVPSKDMPKECARIFLKVTNVRVERLRDISNEDIITEGITSSSIGVVTKYIEIQNKDRKEKFINLWNSTAKDGYKWEDNPYVFAYEFERVDLCKK